ncbi:MAG: hypothetical protein PQJ50_02305, partial [Spirochaetales bacterium]|nr:hypothetical protein [Spirochaetales bacterium]
LTKEEDGTYANYISDTPSLSISYRKKRNIDLGSNPKIFLSTDIEPVFMQKKHHLVWRLLGQYSVELRNSQTQLIYRIDFNSPTEVLLFQRANSLGMVFLQSGFE